MKTMILMHSKVSAGSDVAYINVQSWHFLDGTEWSYRKPESHLWIEIIDVIYMNWFCFEAKWVTLKFLGTKVPCTLGWPYTGGTWLYCDYFIGCVSCTVFVLFCNVWMRVCVGFVMCRCFGNMCTYICCVLYCLYCVFVWFRLRIFILICY